MRNRRRCVIILVFIFIAGLTMDSKVYATDGVVNEAELTPEELKQKEEEERQQELERVYQMPVASNELDNWPEGPSTYGEASIVMDIESGAILYAKNIDEQHYPASITKLLTTLVALENGNLDDRVLVDDDCISFLEWDYAQIGLKDGEEISLEEALYATLLASANEAAYAVAANVGEGYDWFISRMNSRAKELGAENSNFVNANGLHDDDHYTTARDMALISSELFYYPKAFEMMQTMEYQIEPTNMQEEVRYVQQKHGMLNPGYDHYYEYAVGGKTGYTGQALNTLVTYADNGNLHLVCVEMKTLSGKICEDTTNLFEYGFNNFKKVSIINHDSSGDIESVEDDGYVVIPESISFDQLDSEITVDAAGSSGTITYSYGGQEVGSARITLSEEFRQAHNDKVEAVIEPEQEEVAEELPEETAKDGKKALIAIMICLVIIAVVLFIGWQIRKRK